MNTFKPIIPLGNRQTTFLPSFSLSLNLLFCQTLDKQKHDTVVIEIDPQVKLVLSIQEQNLILQFYYDPQGLRNVDKLPPIKNIVKNQYKPQQLNTEFILGEKIGDFVSLPYRDTDMTKIALSYNNITKKFKVLTQDNKHIQTGYVDMPIKHIAPGNMYVNPFAKDYGDNICLGIIDAYIYPKDVTDDNLVYLCANTNINRLTRSRPNKPRITTKDLDYFVDPKDDTVTKDIDVVGGDDRRYHFQITTKEDKPS